MTEQHQGLIVVNDEVERAHRQRDVAGGRKRRNPVANTRRVNIDRMSPVRSTQLQQRVSNERGVADEASRRGGRGGERVTRHRAHRMTIVLRARGRRGGRQCDDGELNYPVRARQ
jgi:hypothetical protein